MEGLHVRRPSEEEMRKKEMREKSILGRGTACAQSDFSRCV